MSQALMPAGEVRRLTLSEFFQYRHEAIQSQTLVRTDDSRIVLFTLDKNTQINEESETHHAVVQVLAGRCEVTVGQDTQELQDGQVLSLPPGTPHLIKAPDKVALLVTRFKAGY